MKMLKSHQITTDNGGIDFLNWCWKIECLSGDTRFTPNKRELSDQVLITIKQ